MRFFKKRNSYISIVLSICMTFTVTNFTVVNTMAMGNKNSNDMISHHGQILGIVKDLVTEIPLQDASVSISDEKVTHVVFTDINGKFSLNNLKKGSHKITINMEDYETIESDLRLESDMITISEFLLSKKRGNLCGFVMSRDNNKPIEGARVSITNGKSTFSQNTDSFGKYSINNIYVGTYGVTASLKDYDVDGPISLSITPESNIKDFSLNKLKGEVFGRAINSKDMNGIKGVNIIVSDGENSYEAVTDLNGDFCIKGIYPGEYEIIATLDGYEEKSFMGIFIDGGNKINQDILF